MVVEAIVDPNIPALPHELNPEQQQKLRQALQGGNPDAEDVIQARTRQGLLV